MRKNARDEKYTVDDMLRWGWIDKEDAERLRKADRKDDQRVERLCRTANPT